MERNIDFIKYPSIPYSESRGNIKGRLYEKIDGSNCQIRNISSRVVPGTRTKRVEEYDKTLEWMKKFHKLISSNQSFSVLDENSTLFCEFFDSEYPRIYFIDLYDISLNRFVEYEKAKEIITKLGIKGLELLKPIDDKETHSRKELETLVRQHYRRNPQFEGFVIKDYENQSFAKIVAEQVDNIFQDILERSSIFPSQIESDDETITSLIEQIKKNTERNVHEEIIKKKWRNLNV